MPEATIFKNMSLPVENKRIIHILRDIKSDKYKQEVEQIRKLNADNDKENADLLKKQLPAFTASGTFKNSRKAESLVEYSQILCLDFDKIDPSLYDMAFQKISAIPQTITCFRSPGGNGIKALLEVNTQPDQHEMAYKQAMSYYESMTGFPCDPKCKDITRLCFVSYDPDTYINESYKRFFIKPGSPAPVAMPSPVISTPDYQALFSECIRFTEQKSQYIDGNRNNFIYLLASNCNRKGIPESIALDSIIANFDLSEQELRASVKSAYNNHSADFAKFADSAKVQRYGATLNTVPETVEEDYLKNTPVITDDIYNLLPDLLKSGSTAFKDNRERDVFMTGALSILSGCIPDVKGVYYQQVVYPNLFSFVIAPAASGKGALKFAKCLGDSYHDRLIEESNDDLKRYKTEMNAYKANMYSRKKGDPPVDPPEQPPFKVLFIPANSSYAKILSHLMQNNECGIICETEADTMGNVLKQEWGSYSDMLRKAFHHERLSSSKKTNNEFHEVKEPRLSVALSGTPNQVTGLIASSEDGLFSRFLFYAYKVEQQWHDVSPYAGDFNLTDHFKGLSDKVFEMINFLNQYPTLVELTRQQWDKLNQTCSAMLTEVTTFTAEDAGSIVKRLGLVLFRICMIFTSLRKFELKNKSNSVFCTESDFEIALHLVQIYLQHTLLIYQNLPKQNDNYAFRYGDNKRRFFEALPSEFKRADAINLATQYNLSIRSVDKLLKELTGKYLSQPQYGSYIKI